MNINVNTANRNLSQMDLSTELSNDLNIPTGIINIIMILDKFTKNLINIGSWLIEAGAMIEDNTGTGNSNAP
jgi:hypothetical protein